MTFPAIRSTGDSVSVGDSPALRVPVTTTSWTGPAASRLDCCARATDCRPVIDATIDRLTIRFSLELGRKNFMASSPEKTGILCRLPGLLLRPPHSRTQRRTRSTLRHNITQLHLASLYCNKCGRSGSADHRDQPKPGSGGTSAGAPGRLSRRPLPLAALGACGAIFDRVVEGAGSASAKCRARGPCARSRGEAALTAS